MAGLLNSTKANMTSIWWQTLCSVTLVSLLSLIGVIVLWINPDQLKKLLLPLISLAVGGLLGDAFLHLIPESFETSKNANHTAMLILLGLFLFLLLEKSMHYYHHHEHEEGEVHPFGYLSLMASGLHNFIDGLLIGASYLASIPIGIATTLAVVLHEIPHELGDFSILIHAGFKPQKALLFNFLSAVLSIGGAIVALSLSSTPETVTDIVLPITAGGFIYIAGSDLIPELHKESNRPAIIIQLLAMFTGAGLMFLVKLLE
jgi:zinc and cadmium transporter